MDISFYLIQGITVVLLAVATPVIVSMTVGLLISVFQAATQIQEQSLTFVPKVIVIFLMLFITSSYLARLFLEFFSDTFSLITEL